MSGYLDLADSNSENMTSFCVGNSGIVSRNFNYSCAREYTAGETRSFMRASAGINGKNLVDYSVRYVFTILPDDVQKLHFINMMAGFSFSEKADMHLILRGHAGEDGPQSLFVKLKAGVNAAPAVSIIPSLSCQFDKNGIKDVVLEYRHILELFEKTSGEFSVSIPFVNTESDGVELYVRCSFLF
jgi:hypothetical protein